MWRFLPTSGSAAMTRVAEVEAGAEHAEQHDQQQTDVGEQPRRGSAWAEAASLARRGAQHHDRMVVRPPLHQTRHRAALHVGTALALASGGGCCLAVLGDLVQVARTPRRCRPSPRTGTRRARRSACAASRRWRRAGRASCSSGRSSRTAVAGTDPGSSPRPGTLKTLIASLTSTPIRSHTSCWRNRSRMRTAASKANFWRSSISTSLSPS